jgi:FHA domain-containing protein
MANCPAGHVSASSDFCDVCGMRIAAPASVSVAHPADLPAAAPPSASTRPAARARPCPRCGTARSGRFCESCGFDFEAVSLSQAGSAVDSSDPATAASTPAVWTAMVASDRAYFKNVVASGGPDAAAVEFPGYTPERRFRLSGLEMRIGRRSVSRGLQPEIDLTGPPTDPGISRLHAVLLSEPDGSWTIMDPGSENGTLVNGREVAAGVRLPLHDGDRIHLGAWTVITIQVA